MTMENPQDEVRRRLLIRALRLGLLGAGSVAFPALAQQLLGAIPGPLPPGRSIYRLDGNVAVNGNTANINTVIRPGDEVRTGPASSVTFVVDEDAYLLRANSQLQLETTSAVVDVVRLFTGALLSVFGRRQTRVATTVATLGIRGTGVYVEAEPDRSYVCTCYGLVDLQSVADPASSESIQSNQHDAPRYVLADGPTGNRIQVAPFINHSDEELAIIEALVGREPPFAVFGEGYDVPRANY